ncbi:nucleotidyltransferase family protein [Plastorhodobacter daqingensis]|uniref:Nucleotidyltransferase family protein n=1 Tax=Plastorhodobacter daqingensis TaxID=1387281 RepID=A0ABW2UD34_9RHOB
MPEAVMIFAAGFGTRMGALTARRPKPLVPVAGRALIDHALDIAADVPRRVVNLHYLHEQLVAHLAGRNVLTSLEWPQILETGGGLRAALPLLGPGPVFTLNSDAVWTGANPLDELRRQWRPDMGALLLLSRPEQARGHNKGGDFDLLPDGRLRRGGPYIYTGAQILRPEGLAAIPDRAFSLNLLWDRLLAKGRLFGAVHEGGWCDVGHPEGIAEAEAMLGINR